MRQCWTTIYVFVFSAYCDKLKDAKIIFSVNKENYMNGDVIHYQCIDYMHGDESGLATCINSKWNKTIEC